MKIVWEVKEQSGEDNEHSVWVEQQPLHEAFDVERRVVLDFASLPTDRRAVIYLPAEEARKLAIQLIEAAHSVDMEDKSQNVAANLDDV